jgi:hypothetical protein
MAPSGWAFWAAVCSAVTTGNSPASIPAMECRVVGSTNTVTRNGGAEKRALDSTQRNAALECWWGYGSLTSVRVRGRVVRRGIPVYERPVF